MTKSFFKKELKPLTIKWIFQKIVVVLFIERRIPQFKNKKNSSGLVSTQPPSLELINQKKVVKVS